MVIVDVILFSGARITEVRDVKHIQEQNYLLDTRGIVQIQHFIRKTNRYLSDLENIQGLRSMLRGAVITTLRADHSESVMVCADPWYQTQTAVGVVEDSMVMVVGKDGILDSGLICREMGVPRDLI
jgi:hypothetical protein